MHPNSVILFIVCFLGGLYFLYYTTIVKNKKMREGLTHNKKSDKFTDRNPNCPNLLIQKGSRIYLYNNRREEVSGINPIVFDNLEQYIEYIDWQRNKGLRCPILYLQHTIDVQGKEVYKIRPSITDPQGGLPPVNTSNLSNTTFIPPSDITPYQDPSPSIMAAPDDKILEGNSLKKSYLYPNPTLLVDATQSDLPFNINSFPAYDPSSFYVGTTTPLDMMNIEEQNKEFSGNAMNSNWGGADYTSKLVDDGYYKDYNVKLWVNNS